MNSLLVSKGDTVFRYCSKTFKLLHIAANLRGSTLGIDQQRNQRDYCNKDQLWLLFIISAMVPALMRQLLPLSAEKICLPKSSFQISFSFTTSKAQVNTTWISSKTKGSSLKIWKCSKTSQWISSSRIKSTAKQTRLSLPKRIAYLLSISRKRKLRSSINLKSR